MKSTKPKGILVPIGGGAGGKDILERICKETQKREPVVCYVTVATTDPEDVKLMLKDFEADIETAVEHIHFDLRSDADSKENLEKIRRCHAVFIGGGNQLRLSSLLGGTQLMEAIKERYYDEQYFVVAGSSAGAAAMSNTMVISGSSQDALIKGELHLTNGLDLINNVFIDTHFTERGRFGRLIQAVTYNPGVLGLGLSTNTGAIIYKGDRMQVVGSGLAVVVDGTEIDYSNLTEVSDGEPITVQGVKMHVLGPGQCFSISQRKLTILKKSDQ
jgi:cyanophycinase